MNKNNNINDINDIEEKYIATFILHALGDTIGFKNGIWEFNFNDVNLNNDYRITSEIIYEFISLGGITNINLKNWTISDDTLLNYEIAKFVLNIKDNLDEKNIIYLKNEITKMVNKQIELNIERGFGSMTITAINKWTDKKDQRHESYNEKSGGNGCTMRTFPIGLKYYSDKDLDKLIEISIISSKITHNSPVGFLGGLGSAYFIKLALNKVNIKKWPEMYIKLLESEEVKKYININNDDEYFDYRSTIRVWKKYVELFLNDSIKEDKIKINLIGRIKLFMNLNEYVYPDSKYNNYAGSTGPTSLIMAYDAVLESNGIWEKVVYYAMLHSGDSDTVGAIAGALYGILYGFKNVPNHLLDNLEMKEELKQMGKKFYEIYKS
jgi:ADP-ribosylarginine hydrolase